MHIFHNLISINIKSYKDSCLLGLAKKCVTSLNEEFVQEDNCSVSCPLECESVHYTMTPQSIAYTPSATKLKFWKDNLQVN